MLPFHLTVLLVLRLHRAYDWMISLRVLRHKIIICYWWIFSNLPNPSDRTMALRSTQPLTEMSTRNLKKKKPGGKVRQARRADNLAAIC
jgi:hypothetical protein